MTEMATQAEVDALTASLTTAQEAIEAEITKIEEANPGVDLTGLSAEVQKIGEIATPVAAEAPTPAP